MTSIDWAIVGVYLLISLGIGVAFVKRASRSMEDYFVAGRSLPWWVIGFANCATYTGASAAFVGLIFRYGLVGNFFWWTSWIVWLPLVAVLWARYWRRLGIVTTAEFIEVRYSGRTARAYRALYAFYNAFGWAPLLTGYVTGWMVVMFQPILGWSPFEITLACGALTMVYTIVSGMFGIAYNDVFQFVLYVAAGFLLLPPLLGHFGGYDAMVAAAVQRRGTAFMQILPPTGDLTPLVLLALFVQGFFFAASPTAGEGTTAQRFMSARDEVHAALGQMLSAFLSLVVRLVPFIVFAIAAAALYPADDPQHPEKVWAPLVLRFASPTTGLLGLIVAAELAGYMSTADAYMNWGGSFITNDIYRRLIRPDASDRTLALVGKLTSAGIIALSFLVTLFLVEGMTSWFMYINSVMVVFILPLAWLRFFWWRLNVWGEAAGVVLGLPLGYLIWFPLGFKDQPLWVGSFILFGMGWAAILLVTWLTPPENMETLREFYRRCRPLGFWGPVAASFPEEFRERIRRDTRRCLTDCALGVVVCGAMVVLLNACVARSAPVALASVAAMAVTGFVFLRRWRAGFDDPDAAAREVGVR